MALINPMIPSDYLITCDFCDKKIAQQKMVPLFQYGVAVMGICPECAEVNHIKVTECEICGMELNGGDRCYHHSR